MNIRLTHTALAGLAFAACICLPAVPAQANDYVVTANFTDATDPGPASITFDYTSPTIAVSNYSPVSPTITWDFGCDILVCSETGLTFNTSPGNNQSTLTLDYTEWFGLIPTSESVTVSNITTPGTYNGAGISITVVDPPGGTVPESTSYLELILAAAGLAACGLWGYSSIQRA